MINRYGGFLEQGAATSVRVGPFLDDTDQKSPETTLTINQADVRLAKNDGAFAQKNDANAASHDEYGHYGVALDATDTDTVGRLVVAVLVAGALPVRITYTVVPSNVFDSLIGGTDYLQVDGVEISGDSGAADNMEAAFDDTTGYDMTNSTIGSVDDFGSSATDDIEDAVEDGLDDYSAATTGQVSSARGVS